MVVSFKVISTEDRWRNSVNRNLYFIRTLIIKGSHMELENNQSAIILESSEEGEITVNVASTDTDGLTGKLCFLIARKLMEDHEFQNELMEMLDDDSNFG